MGFFSLPKSLLVAKFEYLRVVKKKSFWLITLFLPVFILVIAFLIAYSGKVAETTLFQEVSPEDTLYIKDNTDIIKKSLFTWNIQKTDNKKESIQKVENQEIKAFVFLDEDFFENQEIKIYQNKDSIFEWTWVDSYISYLVEESILQQLEEDEKNIVQRWFDIESISYLEWEQISPEDYWKFLIAGIWVFLYFIMLVNSSQFMLSSVSQEKETRLIEMILTTLRSSSLIVGKVLGILGIVLTQILFVTIFPLLWWIYIVLNTDWILQNFWVEINIWVFEVFYIMFYLFSGYLIFSAAMVAVSAAVPTQREAHSFAAPFIISFVVPIYLSGAIIANPSWPLALFFSYFPITAPMLLLFRNLIDSLSIVEFLFSSLIVVSYVVFMFRIAWKVFERWSMVFDGRINFFKQKS